MISPKVHFAALVLAGIFFCCAGSLFGQQKPQWVPGQIGLNAGILPSPGVTYANITMNYSAERFNGTNGKPVPATGNYDVWAVENAFYYVSDFKVLGGNLAFAVVLTPATGSLDADIQIPAAGNANLSATAGGGGLADLFFQPITLGWNFKHVDFMTADALVFPTGRYTPGASDNVGTGYFGNHLQTGTTLYLTKNKATTANLFTDWEVHGAKAGTDNTVKTPGQAFTDEWGLGQILPLKKNFSQLLQVGVVGYDQWQVTANGGTVAIGGLIAPASLLPYYSVHAVGGQVTYLAPPKNLSLYFKYDHEYAASSHFQGNTIVFGGTWTLPIPKPAPPKS